MNRAHLLRILGDPDEDYDSFEKCIVRAIDALDALIPHLEDFAQDQDDTVTRTGLRSQAAVCSSLRDSLRDWGLGIPRHEVKR